LKILIPSIQTPFIKGGGYFHILNLKKALLEYGHSVEIASFPFKFSPESYVETLMEYTSKQDFTNFNGHHIDCVIALQFPAYYVQHPHKILWLMHQYRAVYDIYSESKATKELNILKDKITQYDTYHLSKIKNRFANSKRVASRLKEFNGIESIPLYHPPTDEEKFYCDESLDYVFFPSRLEKLKRQDLLIEAMKYTKSPIKAIIAGSGGESVNYQHLINKLNLNYKVKLTGEISQEEKFAFFANSLAIIYPPFDEDYGYITLEAMLSSKAVITCSDAGGVLEFVEDKYTGFIIEPNPRELAQKIDWLYYNRERAKEMGKNGKELYLSKNISWYGVVKKLLEGI